MLEIFKALWKESSIQQKTEIIDYIKNGESKKKQFKKPTVEEINEYCMDRENTVDAGAFYAFYESKGWKVGKNPMKDWKAAVRTWEKRCEKDSANKVFDAAEYVLNAIESDS